MVNNSNPYDIDGRQVRNRGRSAGDTTRATVLDVLPEIHAVRVNERGEDAPMIAPVGVGRYGMQCLPSSGDRVTVMYLAEGVPIVLNSIYLQDGVQPPDLDPGDVRIGNGSGSHLTVEEGGDVNLQPREGSTVSFGTNIEGCGTYMSSNQDIATDNTFHRLNFDTARYDPTGIHDDTNYEVIVQEDGLYSLNAVAKMDTAGSNTNVEIAINVNDQRVVSEDRESTPSGPISPTCQATRYLSKGDVIFVEFRIDGGSTDTIVGGDEDSEFDVTRLGSLGPTNVQSTSYTDEEAQDAVAEALVGVGGTDVSYDDGGDTITVESDPPYSDEDAQDAVADLVAGGTNVSATYDDANDTLTIDTSALDEEGVQDTVADLLSAGDNISWNYNDANDILTVSLSGPITGVQLGTDAAREDVYGAAGNFESVSTGKVSITDSGVIDYGDISGGSVGLISVTFSESHDSPPIVNHTAGSTQSGEPVNSSHAVARGITTTGFEGGVRNDSGSTHNYNHCGYTVIDQ